MSGLDISGAWRGAVLLHGSRQLAQAVAAVIYSDEPGGGHEQGSLDAMYELTNSIGGNFRFPCPGPCQHSLPTVESTKDSQLPILGMQ